MSIVPIGTAALNAWNVLSNASFSLASLVSEAVNGKCFVPDTHPNGTFDPIPTDFQIGYRPRTDQSPPPPDDAQSLKNRTSAVVIARVSHPVSLKFNLFTHIPDIREKGFDLHDFTYDAFEEFCNQIELISQEKRVQLIVFTGHGFASRLEITKERIITPDNDFRTCIEKIDSNALLIFSSCNMGRGPDPFAQWISDQTGRRVFAAQLPIHADQLGFYDFPDKPHFNNGVEEVGKMFFPSWRVPSEWEKVLRNFRRKEIDDIDVQLEDAAYDGDFEGVEKALKLNLTTRAARGQAVEFAAGREDWKMIEKILSYGPIWARNSGLASVAAASGGRSAVIDYFYSIGPIHHRHTGEAVIAALEAGYGEEVVAPLLKRQIYYAHREKALKIAAKKGDHAVVSLLLANDTLAQSVRKEALYIALDEQHALTAELLLKNIYPNSDFLCLELGERIQCIPVPKAQWDEHEHKKNPWFPKGLVLRTPTVLY
jgi:hypothetical protein